MSKEKYNIELWEASTEGNLEGCINDGWEILPESIDSSDKWELIDSSDEWELAPMAGDGNKETPVYEAHKISDSEQEMTTQYNMQGPELPPIYQADKCYSCEEMARIMKLCELAFNTHWLESKPMDMEIAGETNIV